MYGLLKSVYDDLVTFTFILRLYGFVLNSPELQIG